MARRRRAAAVLTLCALVGGCGTAQDPRQAASAPAVSAARAKAVAEADALLGHFLGLGRELGRSSEDWCDPGDHSWWSDDVYALRCGLIRSVLIAPSATSGPSATAAMRAALASGGCRVRGLPADASSVPPGTLGGPAGTDCRSTTSVTVHWFSDAAGIRLVEHPYPPGPNGFDVAYSPLPDAAVAAGGAAEPLVWRVSASAVYYEQPASG